MVCSTSSCAVFAEGCRAGAGAIIGEVVADEATKGAIIGAVAGTAIAVATKGDQIVLPAGQRLRVRLTEPVTLEL